MYHKAKRNEAKQVPGESHSVRTESEKDKNREMIISASSDKKKDSIGKNPKHAGLSEKFFLSDLTED